MGSVGVILILITVVVVIIAAIVLAVIFSKKLFNNIFTASIGEHKLKIECTYKKVELYIDDVLQDAFYGMQLMSCKLLAKVDGLEIKSNVCYDFVGYSCALFIDDKKVDIIKVNKKSLNV